jgi:hypothetical protein
MLSFGVFLFRWLLEEYKKTLSDNRRPKSRVRGSPTPRKPRHEELGGARLGLESGGNRIRARRMLSTFKSLWQCDWGITNGQEGGNPSKVLVIAAPPGSFLAIPDPAITQSKQLSHSRMPRIL